MAKRPVYLPTNDEHALVKTEMVEFTWFPGMAASQKQKSVDSLHGAAVEQGICDCPLEVSSKSLVELGVKLSAFNLKVKNKNKDNEYSVETLFQSSKVFENGGPYRDLLYETPVAAKKDPRLKKSGHLVGFLTEKSGKWPLEPKTAFYDWIYLNTLKENEWAVQELENFDAFTDIEFNPKKSFSCQAHSVALFKSLRKRKLLSDALKSKVDFLDVLAQYSNHDAYDHQPRQQELL